MEDSAWHHLHPGRFEAHALTFQDVTKYYINYCKEKQQAETMVLRNSVPPSGSSGAVGAFNRRKLKRSWDADAENAVVPGDVMVDSNIVHNKLLYNAGGYGIKRGKSRQDMEKRIDTKLEEAYRNEHKMQPNLLYYLILYAYLEHDNTNPISISQHGDLGLVIDEGENTLFNTVDCTINRSELLLLPALYVS